MSKLVTIYIDGIGYEVPAGTNLVDVAKFYANNDIPVFCYHPKMEPVGMCRMCLVEMGSVEKDRETGAVLLDEQGNVKIRWMPKLQTACTQAVYDGLAVKTQTQQVTEAREDIVEFLLTSHPLDCPICDKGGECPLQNLTMRHGPGVSVFNFDDKVHLAKHVPLGELIYLDRERCIQCARCTRFSAELAGDDVLAFHERGRSLQIVTVSNPPFDSKFSGNTTDICPVGALTTADFRFGARPWELKDVPSIDPYGPEGANISLSTRLDRDSGGIVIIKRVMPRQNEHVNEIWISDKTRFGHHHTRHLDRLVAPLHREKNALVETTWDKAFKQVADKLKGAASVGAIAGPGLSNEDLWELRQLVLAAGGSEKSLGIWPATMSGGEVIKQVGVAKGTNFSNMGKGTVIVLVATDLEEEAPIWWLRAKTARDRGATVVVLNGRSTKMDHYAKFSLRYDYGDAIGAVNSLAGHIVNGKLHKDDALGRVEGFSDLQTTLKKTKAYAGYEAAAEAIASAENVVVFCGAEGVTLSQHADLMQACANVLVLTGHVGRTNNGLIAVWPGANTQGALDLGYSAEATADLLQNPPAVLIVAGCNPVGEDVAAAKLKDVDFVIVTSQFDTATTEIADVVLPQQSFAEREGTFTSGERRVQRFYAAQGVIGDSLPDWKIFAQTRQLVDKSHAKVSAGAVMAEITKSVAGYGEMGYKNLAQIERQFPDVGGNDLYYGGTAYQNTGGIGVQWPVLAENAEAKLKVAAVNTEKSKAKGLLIVPTTLLYDRGALFVRSELMSLRIPEAHANFSPADAKKLKIQDGDTVEISVENATLVVRAKVNETIPAGVITLPKCLSDQPGLFAPVVAGSIVTQALVATGD
ncbi:MAG: molybdopterin-dependent oxidoreductase [Chloroflexi bacterium]|nr:molybdopterin-dependent oxidoreductase [Chloroflexota bacterium]